MSEKICFRDIGTEAVYYNNQYCSEWKENIKCVPAPNEVWECRTKEDGLIRCNAYGYSEYTIEGSCIVSGVKPKNQPSI